MFKMDKKMLYGSAQDSNAFEVPNVLKMPSFKSTAGSNPIIFLQRRDRRYYFLRPLFVLLCV